MSLPRKFYIIFATLEENRDLTQFSLDELQDSLINHEHVFNRSNMSFENAFSTNSSISCGEEGEEINIEEKEGVFIEVDVLQILVEEWCHREEELTIMEMACSVLAAKHLSNEYWYEEYKL